MAEMKACGDCSACCTILGVTELKKPAGQPCEHCTGKSCRIHDDPQRFPATCDDFVCGWKLSNLPDEFRPDRCKIVITGEHKDLYCHIVHVDPAHPYAPHTIVGSELLQLILHQGQYPSILLITGDDERIISRNPVSAQILQRKLRALREEQTRSG